MDAKLAPLTRIEMVEARRYHCGAISRTLRTDHKRVVVGLGLEVHHELTMRYFESSYRRAIIADGQCVMLWGVTGPLIAPEGLVWLAVSDFATRYPVRLLKGTRAELAELMKIKRKLTTVIFEEDAASLRFAYALGFRRVGVEKIGHGLAAVMTLEETR